MARTGPVRLVRPAATQRTQVPVPRKRLKLTCKSKTSSNGQNSKVKSNSSIIENENNESEVKPEIVACPTPKNIENECSSEVVPSGQISDITKNTTNTDITDPGKSVTRRTRSSLKIEDGSNSDVKISESCPTKVDPLVSSLDQNFASRQNCTVVKDSPVVIRDMKHYWLIDRSKSSKDLPTPPTTTRERDTFRTRYILPNLNSSPALTQEMILRVKEMFQRDGNDFVHTPSLFHVNLQIRDLRNYGRGEWLSDQAINFYFEMIKARNNAEGSNLSRIYVFQAEIIKLYFAHDCEYDIIEDTAHEDIFQYQHIFFPIHVKSHWKLIHVDTGKKMITSIDSLKYDNTNSIEGVCKYLINEYTKLQRLNIHTKPTQRFFKDWYKMNKTVDVPQQCNYSDCGIFLLQFADYISRGKSFDFNQKNMPYFRQRMAFETIQGHLLNAPDDIKVL